MVSWQKWVFLNSEQVAERTREETAGSGQYAGAVENTEEQRKVGLMFKATKMWTLIFVNRAGNALPRVFGRDV